MVALTTAAEASDAPAFLDGVVLAAPEGYMLVRGELMDEHTNEHTVRPMEDAGPGGASSRMSAAHGPLLAAGSRPWDEWYLSLIHI